MCIGYYLATRLYTAFEQRSVVHGTSYERSTRNLRDTTIFVVQ